jgi:hypothetical protein
MPVELTGPRLEQLRGVIEAESKDGLKLMMEGHPICSIHLDGTVPCVTVTWSGYVTSTQYRYCHELLIELLRQRNISRMLDDATALPTIHGADQGWVVGNWLPRAIAAGLQAVASKRPQAYFGRLAVEAIRSVPSSEIPMRCFDDLESARVWLKTLR